jgi:hypothetical protein
LEETEIKTDKSAITLSSSAAAGQILANIGITASEITYSIIDTDYYDPYYSAIGTIGTQYTTFGNEYISPNPGFPPQHRRGSFNSKSGPASGNETWAEVRSEYVNGSSYAFIRATDLGGAYPANIIQTGDVGSSQYTKIEQNYNQILIESSNTGFYGIQYDQDWAANYSNRSLVDKEYVDNAVAGGGGSAGITYSGLMNYTTYFDTDNSLDYTDTYYNSGRTTFGLDPYYPWMWDQVGKLNVYFPQSVQPAIIAEGGQFGGMFIAADNTAGGQLIGLQSFAHGSQVSGNLGLYSRADGTQSANIGGQFVAYDGILYPGYTGAANTGIFVDVYSGTVDPSIAGLTNSGIQVVVSGRAGDNNYIGQFQDGSEGAGKVLTCIDGTGLATWQTPTPSGGGGTVSQILTEVRNQSGATIHRGKVVYISGSTGNLPLITLSQADTESTSARTYGIVRDDISNNGTGYVVAIGAIQNLDTRSTATNPFTSDTLADGNRLYLSPTTAGYVTNVKPSAPNHLVYIGTVIRTSPTVGYIEYQIQNGYELDEIHDVSIPTTPTDGQVLTYESATSLWKAKNPNGGAGTGTSSRSVDTSSDTIGYLNTGTIQLYKMTKKTSTYAATSGTFNGETIYIHSFRCEPGQVINSIGMRIQTAGAAGLGLAECRLVIYRSKLDANGNIIIGDLELDPGVSFNTLSPGPKILTGLNHTLSTNTSKDMWWIGLRNYQTGSLSVKLIVNTSLLTEYAELAASGTTMARDNAWYWTVPWNAAMPASGPTMSASAPTTTRLASADSSILWCGYSRT